MTGYRAFWDELIAKIDDEEHPFYRWKHKKRDRNEINQSIERFSELKWKFYAKRLRSEFPSVELYIMADHVDETRRIYEALLQHRDEIEARFGAPLQWNERDKPDGGTRIIYYTIRDSGTWDGAQREALQHEMIAQMKRLTEAFEPYIRQAKKGV